jgi:hypothetical protein
VVPVERHETSEEGTILVSGFSSRNRRGRSVSEAPPLAGRLVESGTPHAPTSVTAAAMWWVDAPETSLPKQAPANSSVNLLRPAVAKRAGPTEISLTLRGCAVSAAHDRNVVGNLWSDPTEGTHRKRTARFMFECPRGPFDWGARRPP